MSNQGPALGRPNRISRIYGIAQSALLCVFTVIYFLDPGGKVFDSSIAGATGGVLCLVGLFGMFVAFVSLGDSIQISPEPKKSGKLVTKGIYRYFRHPIYSGIVVLVVGLFLRRPTILIGIGGVTVIVFLLVKARFEEKLLLMRYRQYAQYRKKTWGVIPWF